MEAIRKSKRISIEINIENCLLTEEEEDSSSF